LKNTKRRRKEEGEGIKEENRVLNNRNE